LNSTVEILVYRLKPGEGAAFHDIMEQSSIPLHHSHGMRVIAFGRSVSDPDAYHLVRAYESVEHMTTSQDAFYASADWRSGPREAIVARIESSLRSVLTMPEEALAALERATG
jgi:hypothetical protein